MDTIVVIMFGSVVTVMTALSFLEVRRIRKLIESHRAIVRAPEDPKQVK